MWVENLPASTTNMLVTTEAADEKITALNDTHTKFQFQADALSLARDAAQLARLFGEESKTERACRMARVCHLRQENQIGSSLASQYLRQHCHHRAGPLHDLQDELSKAGKYWNIPLASKCAPWKRC